MIDRGKRSKTLSEVKPVENISKNLQSFLEISPVQKEVLLSHKLRDHAYEYQNPFELKEDNPSQRNCQNQLSHPSLSHIARMSREFDSRKDLQSAKSERRPRKFVNLGFRKFCGSYLVYILWIICPQFIELKTGQKKKGCQLKRQ